MAESVKKRFPNHINKIDDLLTSSPTFREICADHEELSTLLQGRCESGACDYARELLGELETEILDYLEGSRPLFD